MKLSFVIPCYRSENTIQDVAAEIVRMVRMRPGTDYEIICVNDGSPDNVIQVLHRLAKEDPHVCVVDLIRNFGQQNARMAGLNQVTGDYVVCLDDDGQCPLDKLWDLLAPVVDGDADCAIARYPHKTQSRFKNFGSRVNSYTTHWVLDMPKNVEMSNFFTYRRVICDCIIQYQNPYPFSSGLIFRTTKRVVNVPMEERERASGSSGYTFRKLISLWADGLTSFSVKPLRIADLMGALFAVIGLLYGFITVLRKLLNPAMSAGYASTIAIMLFIGGCLMLQLGLVGEYVGRIFICQNSSPQFLVRSVFRAQTAEEAELSSVR